MTNLEQKIYAEITSYQDREKAAKEIAKIALELAQEAYEFGIDRTNDIRPFSEFIKNYDF